MGFTSLGLQLLFLPETYAPVILARKATKLRHITKNWAIHARRDEVEVDLKELATKHITRPLRLIFTEPIVLLVAIYMAFIFGLVYLSLTAFALVFQGVYGMNEGVGGLPYLGTVFGELLAFAVVVIQNKGYIRKLEANNNIPVPEWRLPLVLAIGFFWFGWTGYTGKIPWIVPTLAGLCLGFGIFATFIGLTNYLVDS
jgi:DHA1 family multidrug resistance protein-like MFS transporter